MLPDGFPVGYIQLGTRLVWACYPNSLPHPFITSSHHIVASKQCVAVHWMLLSNQSFEFHILCSGLFRTVNNKYSNEYHYQPLLVNSDDPNMVIVGIDKKQHSITCINSTSIALGMRLHSKLNELYISETFTYE